MGPLVPGALVVSFRPGGWKKTLPDTRQVNHLGAPLVAARVLEI